MKRFMVAMILAVPMFTGTGYAAPITVNAGQSVTFNFDFASAGAIPAPPYDRMSFFTGIADLDAADAGAWNFFSGLDGNGTTFASSALGDTIFWGGANVYVPFGGFMDYGYSEWLDGVFSVTLAVTRGSISIDPAAEGLFWFQGVLWNGVVVSGVSAGTQLIYPTISVPEPSVVSLLGVGVLSIGLFRYKHRS